DLLCAPPTLAVAGQVDRPFYGDQAAGRRQVVDPAEQPMLVRGRQVLEQAFRDPDRGYGRIETGRTQGTRPVAAQVDAHGDPRTRGDSAVRPTPESIPPAG